MSCEKPLLAVNLGKFEGKNKIKILGNVEVNVHKAEMKYGRDNLLLLPCGKCPSCKQAHQKEWAVRCALESKYYKENCMVTLTYDQKHRPGTLRKDHLQKFIKKLRNHGIQFRYFACGEYTKAGYPHYHMIMFGYWPQDAVADCKSDKGFPVYRSDFIEQMWDQGIISVSEMSPGTAAYVAGYVDKKLGLGEFSMMSRKPGIGERYFREHLLDIYKYDNLVGSFGVAKTPRYCDKLADQAWMDISEIKDMRKKACNDSLLQVMHQHDLKYKDEAVGFNARQKRESLLRKKRL